MKKRVISNTAIIIFLLAASLLFCYPYLRSGLGVPQDTRFHLDRILGMSNVWRSPVNFLTYANRGNMVAPYYPWITLYPAFLLYKVFGSLTVAYKVYMFSLIFIGSLTSYFSFLSINKNRGRATIFATLYTFASYHATNVFLRGAVGEVLCAVFLPIAFLGLYEVLRGNWRKWPLLTAGMTLILYSHLLSLAITAALMLVLTVLALPGMQDWQRRLIAGVKATLLTLLLSVGFIVPFLQISRVQKVALPVAHLLERGTVPPSQLISDMLNNYWGTYGLGLVILIAVAGSIIMWRQLAGWERALLGLSLLMIFVLTTLFPIAHFNHTLLNELQFIWRLNAFTSLFVLYVFCAHLPAIHFGWQFIVSGVVLLGVLASMHYTSYKTVRNSQMFFPAGQGLVYNDANAEHLTRTYPHSDYRPENALNPAYVTDFRPRMRGQVVKLAAQYTADQATFTVNNHKRAGILRTSVYRYDSALVHVNGKAVATYNVDGLTGVKVPHGKTVITIRYKYSGLTYLARAISIITLILTLAWPWWGKWFKRRLDLGTPVARHAAN